MKKLLLFVIMITGLTTSSFAQEKKVSFGLRAGVNFSYFKNTVNKVNGLIKNDEGTFLKDANGDYLFNPDGTYQKTDVRDYLMGKKYFMEDGGYYVSADSKLLIGGNVGMVVDFKVANSNFYIQPGLFFTTGGTEFTYRLRSEDKALDNVVVGKEKIKSNYLQLPIIFSYRIYVSDNVKVALEMGPYFGLGISGKAKRVYDYDTPVFIDGEHSFPSTMFVEHLYEKECNLFGVANDVTEPYATNKGKAGLKRFDSGLRFGAGVHIHRFYVGAAYDLGLYDMTNNKLWNKDCKFKNRNISVNVGVNF